MNKRQIVASLNKIANELDGSGLYNEAYSLTQIMKKIALDMKMDFLESEEDFNDPYVKAVRNAREAVQKFVSFLDQNIDNPEELQNLKEHPKPVDIFLNNLDLIYDSHSGKIRKPGDARFKIVDLKDPSKPILSDEGRVFNIHRDSSKEKIQGLFLHLLLNLYDSDNDEDYCQFAMEGYKIFENVSFNINPQFAGFYDALNNVVWSLKNLARVCWDNKKIK